MTLKDIGKYKNKLLSIIVKSKDICEAILGVNYNEENVDEQLIYSNIFPYCKDKEKKRYQQICYRLFNCHSVNYIIKHFRFLHSYFCLIISYIITMQMSLSIAVPSTFASFPKMYSSHSVSCLSLP